MVAKFKNRTALYPLWPPGAQDILSDVFRVLPSQCAVIVTTGLEGNKTRKDASEFVVPKMMCVRQVLFDYEAPDNSCLPCDFIFDRDFFKGKTVLDTLVYTCGLPWAFDECRNIGVIGLPGAYRLELNDQDSVGVAQAFITIYHKDLLPIQVAQHFL